MKRLLVVLGYCVITAACEGSNPVAPSRVTIANVLPPQEVFSQPFTDLQIGSTLRRTVSSEANPECPGLPGWGCQFFRVTPATDGLLGIAVNWLVETQPNQSLDLSLESVDGGSQWAGVFGQGALGLQERVQTGRTYQITVWYTFPGVTFEVSTSMDTP